MESCNHCRSGSCHDVIALAWMNLAISPGGMIGHLQPLTFQDTFLYVFNRFHHNILIKIIWEMSMSPDFQLKLFCWHPLIRSEQMSETWEKGSEAIVEHLPALCFFFYLLKKAASSVPQRAQRGVVCGKTVLRTQSGKLIQKSLWRWSNFRNMFINLLCFYFNVCIVVYKNLSKELYQKAEANFTW
jgi:hypothetical protein